LSGLARTLYCNRAFRWLLVLLWMGVIYAFSDQARSGELTEKIFGVFNLLVRKSAHMAEYGILFGLTRWASMAGDRPSAMVPGFAAFCVSLLYAISDEWHQSFVPGRSAKPMDVVVDMAGVMIAAFMLPYFLALKSFWSRTRS
jgi:VanZ family protein